MRTRRSNPMHLPGSATEEQLHRSVAEFLDWCLVAPAFYTTFPAGYGRLGKATAGALRAKGMKAGMPDILVFARNKVIGIELKAYGNGTTSKQREMHAKLQAVGVRVYVCHSVEEVADALNNSAIAIMRTLAVFGKQTNEQRKSA